MTRPRDRQTAVRHSGFVVLGMKRAAKAMDAGYSDSASLNRAFRNGGFARAQCYVLIIRK
jgi:hypothetical protein